MYFLDDGGNRITFENLEYEETGENASVTLRGTAAGDIKILFDRTSMTMSAESDFILANETDPSSPHLPSVISVNGKETVFGYCGQRYALKLSCGNFINGNGIPMIASEGGRISFQF